MSKLLGLATAILVDATVVRMVLVPATIELLGDRNGWFPRWLDRIVPQLHVEAGPDVDAELALLTEREPTRVGGRARRYSAGISNPHARSHP